MPTTKTEKRRRSAPEYLKDYETDGREDSAKKSRSSDEQDYNSDGSTTSAASSSSSSSENAISEMVNFVTAPVATSNINVDQESEEVLNTRLMAVNLEQARLRREATKAQGQKRSFYDDVARANNSANDSANDIDSSDNDTDSGYNTDRSSSSIGSAISGSSSDEPAHLMNRMDLNGAAASPAPKINLPHVETPGSLLRPNPANALLNLEAERRRALETQPETKASAKLNLNKVYEEEERAEFNEALQALQGDLDIIAASDEEVLERDISMSSDRWDFDRSSNCSVSEEIFHDQDSESEQEEDQNTGSWLDGLDDDLDINDFGPGL